LREAGCLEDEGRQQAHAYPRKAPARDRGQDRLPRDPQGNARRGFYEKHGYGTSAEDIEMSHGLEDSEEG
jgi:hypothetical protein